MLCKICNNGFEKSPDNLIMCEHKEGPVHLGCCVSQCSMHGQPCDHSVAVYERLKD